MSEYTVVAEYNNQGLILYSQDKYDEALVYFEKAISEDPHFINSYINAAQVYIMRDEYDDAIKYLKKALLLDKKCAIVYFHLGNIDLLKGNTDEAKENYNKSISLGYDNVQIYINLASDAEENGDFDSALSYYNKVIAIDKFNAYAKARKIEINVMLKRIPEALKACDDLIETNPDTFEGYHYKFALLTDNGKHNEAEQILERAITLFPDDEAFFYDKARLLQIQGKYQEAIDLLENKLTLNEDNKASLISLKGQLLLSLERVDEAKVLFEKEFEENEDSEIAYFLTSIYMALKEYDKAIVCAEKVIDADNKNDDYYFAALYYKAVALKKANRDVEAKKALNEAILIFRAATSRQPGQIQLYFYRAICHKEIDELDKAMELIDFVLGVKSDLAEAHLIKSEILKEMGKDDEALKEKEQAFSYNPDLKSMMEE